MSSSTWNAAESIVKAEAQLSQEHSAGEENSTRTALTPYRPHQPCPWAPFTGWAVFAWGMAADAITACHLPELQNPSLILPLFSQV